VLKLVIRQSWKLAAIGLGIGLPLAYGLSRVMRSTLFGVVEVNGILFLGLALLVIFVALVAGYLPARRAMDADPIGALRSE